MKALALFVLLAASFAAASQPDDLIVLSDDGGWCWYQDERAILHDGKLIFGTIAMGTTDRQRKGDAEVIVHDIATGQTQRLTFVDNIGADDHNVPAFELLPDGRILAIAATHGATNWFAWRIAEAGDPTRWTPVQRFTPTEKSRITYQNVYRLPAENNRIYNFYRGLDNSFKPSYAFSDDLGASWKSGNVFIEVPVKVRHRPYVKYASNGHDTVHMVYTEGHPRDFDNSVYHIFYRAGQLHASAGTPIAPLAEGISKPDQGTKIYQGGETHVAWTQDMQLDAQGRPVVVFSVQRDPKRLPPADPASGQDHRYHYARWDGQQWIEHEIAFAGTRLYPVEDDYTGLIVIDPDDVSTVYISTDAHPVTGKPLISSADGQRHYEIFKGVTADGGATWSWTAITSDSTADNIRPIVPRSDGKHAALLWLRGKLKTYTDYNLQVVGIVRKRP